MVSRIKSGDTFLGVCVVYLACSPAAVRASSKGSRSARARIDRLLLCSPLRVVVCFSFLWASFSLSLSLSLSLSACFWSIYRTPCPAYCCSYSHPLFAARRRMRTNVVSDGTTVDLSSVNLWRKDFNYSGTGIQQ